MILKYANLALRFLLEICALAALGYWGFNIKRRLIIKFALGVGAPLLAAVVWGMFVAPYSSYSSHKLLKLFLEVFILGSAAVALYFSEQPYKAMVFGVLVIVNRILMHIWGQ